MQEKALSQDEERKWKRRTNDHQLKPQYILATCATQERRRYHKNWNVVVEARVWLLDGVVKKAQRNLLFLKWIILYLYKILNWPFIKLDDYKKKKKKFPWHKAKTIIIQEHLW